MADKDYHRKYWKAYKKRTKQISLTLSVDEYKMWQQAAALQGRKSVGQQIKAEALAYRDQAHLPELDTQHCLSDLIRILRGIGNKLVVDGVERGSGASDADTYTLYRNSVLVSCSVTTARVAVRVRGITPLARLAFATSI